jgi:tRNA(Ile)-lysidine synthase
MENLRKLKFLNDFHVISSSCTLYQVVSAKLSEFIATLNLATCPQQASSQHSVKIAVAYSGGLDSSILLRLVAQYCQSQHINLHAFHVHHGISANADDWLLHAQDVCAQLGISFEYRRVQLLKDGFGVEAAARSARYLALGEMCDNNQINLLLTAHHLDDQAETILLQLLRGTGLAGLAGMDEANYAPNLLGGRNNATTLIARPLLGISKQSLLNYSLQNAISYVDDESNQQTIYARNALRLKVMPMLQELAPGYSERLTRAGEHARAAIGILAEVAQEDFLRCAQDNEISLKELGRLSPARVDNLLRFWMRQLGMKMPSAARLQEIKHQVLSAKEDARITIAHEGWEIHRYRNQLSASLKVDAQSMSDAQLKICWKGEDSLYLPLFKGRLHFDLAESGVSKSNLLGRVLLVRTRQGGERLRLASNRPSRDMKSHFQTAGIPYWKRALLPFVFIESQLLFVADLGLDAAFIDFDVETEKIQLRWQADE